MVGQALVMHSPLGDDVEGNRVGRGNVLTDCYSGARLGEKPFLRGRNIPLLKRKNEGPNQPVQYVLS